MSKDRSINSGRIRYNAKLQIQKYIESFFTGVNKKYLNVSAPGMVYYNIDHSAPLESNNIKERTLQIARYFNELKAVLPSVLIVDGAMTNVPNSVGLLSNSFGNYMEVTSEYATIRNIEMTIIVGSNDIMTTDDITVAVSHMFNELRHVAGGSNIVGDVNKGEKFEVRLPILGVNFSGLRDVAIGDDPTDRIFYSEATLGVQYEDFITFTRSREISLQRGENLDPIFDIPDQIPFDSATQLKIKNYQDGSQVIIDNYKVATINPSGIITPRALGEFNLKLLSPIGKILAEKKVKVV